MIHREHRRLGRRAHGIVQNQPRHHRRQQSLAHLLFAVLRRVRNRSKRRIHRERHPIPAPFIAGPPIRALQLAILERLRIRLHILLRRPRLLHQKRVRRPIHRPHIKRQALQRRARIPVPLLEPDKDLLVARLPNLQSDAPAGPKVPARKAHERPHRRVLSIKAELVSNRFAFHRSAFPRDQEFINSKPIEILSQRPQHPSVRAATPSTSCRVSFRLPAQYPVHFTASS